MVITQNQRIALMWGQRKEALIHSREFKLTQSAEWTFLKIFEMELSWYQSHLLGFSLKGMKNHVLKRHLHVTSTVQAQGSLAHTTPPPVCTYVSSSRFMGTNNAADIHKVGPFRLWDKREVPALLRNTLLGSSGSLATWLTLRNTLWWWTSQTQKGEYYTILHVCGG